jgi:hypothetical protein
MFGYNEKWQNQKFYIEKKLTFMQNTIILIRIRMISWNTMQRYKSKILGNKVDFGKQPITMRMKFDGLVPSFAPMPPEEYVFKAKDLIDLLLKINRWFRKYGYEIK